MDQTPVPVTIDTDQEDVAKMIARYDLLAIPVVDEDGRRVGIVTHDDATDAMEAETTEDFQKISIVLPFTQSLREAGIGVLYSRRIVWLALLVFGNLFRRRHRLFRRDDPGLCLAGVLPALADRQQR